MVVSLRDAPLRRLLQGQNALGQSLITELDSPDSDVVARRQPRAFSATFGPIGLLTPRREGEVGFYGLATLVNVGAYLTPNYPTLQNPLMGQYGDFWWTHSTLTSELSWTYRSNPGATTPVNTLAAGPLFDNVLTRNGGAVLLNNFSNTQQFPTATVYPRCCVEFDIYDKTLGRSLTSQPMSAEGFANGSFGPKKLSTAMLFVRGTEVEPRLYVTESAMSDFLNTTTPYNAASVAVWITLGFYGYTVLP